MKLVFFSDKITPKARKRLFSLFDKQVKDISLAFIPTAAINYEESSKAWVYENRNILASYGIKFTTVRLEEFVNKKASLLKTLSSFDGVYVGGGNTFYLMHYIKRAGFNKVLPLLLTKNFVYIGASAGAIIFNNNMQPIAIVDDPSLSPTTPKEGITDILNFIVIPHWKSKMFGSLMKKVKKCYDEDRITTIPITDTQAIFVENTNITII